jgi:D-serine deaminase-like pyridoxal phosphate-dependent protein
MAQATEVVSPVGLSCDALDTPVLVVDLDDLEFNLQLMADYFADRHCKLRPHFKSHKCVELARRQLAAGSACGITCAKLSEAEQLVAGGINDVLIANQVIGTRKAARLAALNQSAVVRCAVDSIEGVDQLDEQAARLGVAIAVLVEVDVGMHRCGVAPGPAALELARYIGDRPHVRFDGLQGYEGHLVNIFDFEDRQTQVAASIRRLVETRELIERAGIPVAIVSGGSSATYQITGTMAGIDELQCGSYALMDWVYQRLCPEFRISRWILSSILSRQANSVVVDVGLKGAGCDFGPPLVANHAEAQVRYTAEEHMPIDDLQGAIGQTVRLVPSHGCTTNSLYRKLWVLREDVVVDGWDLEGAGCLE